MSQVFISYRQTNDHERTRVRAFAERLCARGIVVILDQFFLDTHPGGPNDGWDKWSSDRALKTPYVIIIGTTEWFQCFEKTQPPGTGLGAACEADDLRHRIYESGGVIGSIRVVVFDDTDTAAIPSKLKRYHRFHTERDFEAIVRWLGDTTPQTTISVTSGPRTSTPHNLPTLQPFFGREVELVKIATTLAPHNHTWGTLIDGPAGMGKTSLAVRAAYDASSEDFARIIFSSLKTRELDDDGVRDLSGFIISGIAELFGELARELGHDDIIKAAEDRRPRLLLDILRNTRTLLVLDNLESLTKAERDTVFTFVKKLPSHCKAILTSRGRIGSGAEELILEQLGEDAALATLDELATHNLALAKTSKEERLILYRETGGKPLLLRWTAGQIGRGHCRIFADAIDYLRSCPEGNDPLEFIFGDLIDDFTDIETRVISALIYFTQPAKVEHIVDLVGDHWRDRTTYLPVESASSLEAVRGAPPRQNFHSPKEEITLALNSLVNRALVVPSDNLQIFAPVPMVADFLRKAKPEVVAETGEHLEKRAYDLIVENGHREYARFPVLDAAWPSVAPALPRFLAGPNERLHVVCQALKFFLEFTGRWDEWLALNLAAEAKAIEVGDHGNAGWRANDIGWVHYLRGQADAVLACAKRASEHWQKAQAGARERAFAIRLSGIGYELKKDYTAAVSAYSDAAELYRTVSAESTDVSLALNPLANAKRLSGDFAGAEQDFREALRIARAVGYAEGEAYTTGNLAALALDREDWSGAETLAREALHLSEKVGRQELIAHACRCLARSLMPRGKREEALPYARRAVDIYTQLGSSDLEPARETLADCES